MEPRPNLELHADGIRLRAEIRVLPERLRDSQSKLFETLSIREDTRAKLQATRGKRLWTLLDNE
jgi:hypothetical protein